MTFAVCVFCGSAAGNRPEYAQAALEVGKEVGRRGWTLVYGGGRVGLMGVLADAALRAGGRVTGVIPRFLYEDELIAFLDRSVRDGLLRPQARELLAVSDDAAALLDVLSSGRR